jgi:hopanoid-associated phosphorylase
MNKAHAHPHGNQPGIAQPQIAHPRIAIVVGLKAEARAAATPLAFVAGGSAARVEQFLAEAGPLDAVLSFGIAGGLSRDFKPGDLVLAEAIVTETETFRADPLWLARLAVRIPHARRGKIAGVDAPVGSREAKLALHRKHGAVAVDMESHGAARFAASANLPFIALRAIADPHHRALPSAALVGMKADGSPDIAAVLAALARQPSQLGGLIQTAFDARAGMQGLLRSRRLLGAFFGFDDLV